ncbi:MAG TPA: hypothetical protein PLQ11_01340 [Beijerinckiaceae bacterium]|nr:hypothetical protein [Beijerinckiaceae bacterium]
MLHKSMIPVAVLAACLMGASGQAMAKSGKNKALLTGGAVGLAAGAVGGYMLGKSQSAPAAQAVDREPTGSTTYHRASARETCSVRSVELFDRKGNFVKSERMRVCN